MSTLQESLLQDFYSEKKCRRAVHVDVLKTQMEALQKPVLAIVTSNYGARFRAPMMRTQR